MLRLFNPDSSKGLSHKMSLPDFFREWYAAEISKAKGRKPISTATIERRGDAIKVWGDLMASHSRPSGPLLDEITADVIGEFVEKLKTHTYSRGGFKRYPYSPATQETLVREIQNVFRAAGPVTANSRVRAGVLNHVEGLYVPPAIVPPARIWTVDEAKSIVNQIDSLKDRKLVALMRATIALWAYTGCRQKMVMALTKDNLHEVSPNETVLIFREQKTSKVSTIPLHRRVLTELQNVARMFKSSLLIPWHVQYRAVADYHDSLVQRAELAKSAQNPPKYWRKWFAHALEVAGSRQLQSLSQSALNHASSATTSRYYSNAASIVIPMIPDIFE